VCLTVAKLDRLRNAIEYGRGSGLPFRTRSILVSWSTTAIRVVPRFSRPADGFYEWQRTGKTKQPYCFEVGEGELFAFAGLWDRWKDRTGNTVESCSILTTTPNAVTSAVYDRMPVILDPDCYDLWLDPGMREVAVTSEMLKPYDARRMRCYPISTRINHVANDDEGCTAPAELAEIQNRLSS
jgi:putative SOS response-associated peptidase YedK